MARRKRVGLSVAEAAARLQRDGPNELPRDQPRGPVRFILDALREPMLQLLLAAGGVYLILGDRAEALILLGFAALNVALVAVQDGRTERALTALRDLTMPVATVIRDGRRSRIASRDLVVGDLIVLAEGDRVPADARLCEGDGLMADEALLTGESVPVRKTSGRTRDPRPDGEPDGEPGGKPGGEDHPHVWSGTLLVRGSGVAEVTATGPRTEIGRIGTSLSRVATAPTPLQRQTRQLVRVFAIAGIGSALCLTVVHGLLHGAWMQAVLAGITLAMAMLPEEFPLVLTVFLTLGAWRISKSHVLTRRSQAIEALGAATVLCTDKTGTLTLNRMTVTMLSVDGLVHPVTADATALPEAFHALVEFAILASRPDPFDPMEQAFHALGQRALAGTEHIHRDWSLVHGYPLEPTLLAMSQVWAARAGDSHVIAAKGAPEAIIDLCHLPPRTSAAIRAQMAVLGGQGLRVLAVAKAAFAGDQWPRTQHDFDFRFLGLVGLADPLRPGVPEAVAACARAGIRVAMITGDHPLTACAIARQAGIPAETALTGEAMAALDDAELRACIRHVSVFARIMPEQKLRLVQAFAANGEIVAMTGDGVNDAPSLKAAHIGVAMGKRGTDVAREAASLVLLDDNFTSLVTAVRLGRRIDDNLRKAISYILAVHVPIAGLSLLPVLLGWPVMLGPIHVVFLELIIDPVSSVVFEAEADEPHAMARPPRDPRAPLFDAWLLARGLLQGGIVLAATMAVFLARIHDVQGAEVARAMAFMTLVLGNLSLVMLNRSIDRPVWKSAMRPNRALGWVLATTLPALMLILTVPALRGLFGFAALSGASMAEAAGAALASLVVNELISVLWRLRRSWSTG